MNIATWRNIDKLKLINKDIAELENAVKVCDGDKALKKAYDATLHQNISWTLGENTLQRIKNRIADNFDDFKENCDCIKLKEFTDADFKFNFESEGNTEFKDRFFNIVEDAIQHTKNCDCAELLNDITGFHLLYVKYVSKIPSEYQNPSKHQQFLDYIRKNWTTRCKCHRKGIGTYSDSIGRYKK